MKFLQRLYNPFKPHVCQLVTGKYAVRKLSVFGWEYLDRVDRDQWWIIRERAAYCAAFSTKEEAIARLIKHDAPEPKFSNRVL